jgi:hypothetical protein
MAQVLTEFSRTMRFNNRYREARCCAKCISYSPADSATRKQGYCTAWDYLPKSQRAVIGTWTCDLWIKRSKAAERKVRESNKKQKEEIGR